MTSDLWTWLLRALSFDIGGEPSPPGPPPRLAMANIGSEPPPDGPPPR